MQTTQQFGPRAIDPKTLTPEATKAMVTSRTPQKAVVGQRQDNYLPFQKFQVGYANAQAQGFPGSSTDYALGLTKEGREIEGWAQFQYERAEQIRKNKEIVAERERKEDLARSYRRFVENEENKNPLVRAFKSVGGGLTGGVKGLYEGVTDGAVDMIRDAKQIINDPNKGSAEKFNQILFGEGIADYLGGAIIGGTFGGALEGMYKGFLTKSERDSVSDGVQKVVQNLMKKETVQKAIGMYEMLPEEQREELNDLLGYGINGADVVGLSALGTQPIKRAGKELLEAGGEQMIKRTHRGLEIAGEVYERSAEGAKKLGQHIREVRENNFQGVVDTIGSRYSGLTPESIATIRENPLYTQFETGEMTRRTLGDELLQSINKRIEDLSDLGGTYQHLRSKDVFVNMENVKNDVINNIFSKYNINVKKGKLDFKGSKFEGDVSDQNAIQKAFDIINETQVDADIALNKRQAITKASRFGSDVSGDGGAVVREIRYAMNKQMHEDINGLELLDEAFAPEIQKLEALKGDYMYKDGRIKDNFYSTVSNILNKGKELKYDRLSEIMPDIDSKISALKAWENVEQAMGIQVGFYDKLLVSFGGATAGGSIGTALLGPSGSMLGSVAGIGTALYLSNPKRFASYLRKQGPRPSQLAKKLEVDPDSITLGEAREIDEIVKQAQDLATKQQQDARPKLPEPTADVIDDMGNVSKSTNTISPEGQTKTPYQTKEVDARTDKRTPEEKWADENRPRLPYNPQVIDEAGNINTRGVQPVRNNVGLIEIDPTQLKRLLDQGKIDEAKELLEGSTFKKAETAESVTPITLYRGLKEGGEKKFGFDAFTDDPEIAKTYGADDLVEKTVTPSNVADFTNPSDDILKIVKDSWEGSEYYDIDRLRKLATAEEIPLGTAFYEVFDDPNVIKALKDEGYDMIKFGDFAGASGQFKKHNTFIDLSEETKPVDTDFENFINELSSSSIVDDLGEYADELDDVVDRQEDYAKIMSQIERGDDYMKALNDIRKRVTEINDMEQRVGKVGKNKVNRAYANTQSIKLARKKNQLLERMMEELGISQEDARDLFDDLS